jgi:hypothetical protein
MAATSTQSYAPKTHLREGAIYCDSSNNIIRLVSIHPDYCVYVYVALGNQRSEMHGSVTGRTEGPHLKLVSYSSQSVWKNGRGVNACEFRLSMIHPP